MRCLADFLICCYQKFCSPAKKLGCLAEKKTAIFAFKKALLANFGQIKALPAHLVTVEFLIVGFGAQATPTIERLSAL